MFKSLGNSKEDKILVDILFKKKIKAKHFVKIDYNKLVKIASSHLMLPALYYNIKKKSILRIFQVTLLDI